MSRILIMLLSVVFYGAAVVALLFLIGWTGAFDFMPLRPEETLSLSTISHRPVTRPGTLL